MNKSNNISDQDDDLTELAPQLSKLRTNSLFHQTEKSHIASDDYFDSLTIKIQNRIDDFEDINAEAPVLSTFSAYNAFKVPADYFDEFPTLIQQRIIDNKSSSTFLEWILLLIKPRFAVPVLTVVFFAAAGINFMTKNAELPETEYADELSVEEQLSTIDESTLIESLTAESTEDETKSPAEEQSIENYLLDNNIDESSLTKM